MTSLEEKVHKMRAFHRFYTRQLGILQEQFLKTSASFTDARLLFELEQQTQLTPSQLGNLLGLDLGYVSRLLQNLEQRNLITRERSTQDGRQRLITLTKTGKELIQTLNQRSEEELSELLQALTEHDQGQLLAAMGTIERLFQKQLKYAEPFFIRQAEANDLGWILYRNTNFYTREYGWNAESVAVTAQIIQDFIHAAHPERERCWVVEREEKIIGSVMLVEKDEQTAQLRLLSVEPEARGLGIAKRLVQECLRFARQQGYERIILMTHAVQAAARSVYQQAGFQLMREETSEHFGKPERVENWELKLK